MVEKKTLGLTFLKINILPIEKVYNVTKMQLLESEIRQQRDMMSSYTNTEEETSLLPDAMITVH